MANDLSNVRLPITPRETILPREDLNMRIYVMQNLFSLYLLYSLRILKTLSFFVQPPQALSVSTIVVSLEVAASYHSDSVFVWVSGGRTVIVNCRKRKKGGGGGGGGGARQG